MSGFEDFMISEATELRAEVQRLMETSTNLRQENEGLQAALYIAREGERIAKERLNAVSLELVAAHQHNMELTRQISDLQIDARDQAFERDTP